MSEDQHQGFRQGDLVRLQDEPWTGDWKESVWVITSIFHIRTRWRARLHLQGLSGWMIVDLDDLVMVEPQGGLLWVSDEVEEYMWGEG